MLQRSSAEEVFYGDPIGKMFLLGVRMAGSRRVLGVFSRKLGGFSAESRQVLEGFLAVPSGFSAFMWRILSGLSCRQALGTFSLNFGGLRRPK